MLSGGHTLYGLAVGILMLDTRFPRPPGDVGNAATWPFPARYRIVKGAESRRVVAKALVSSTRGRCRSSAGWTAKAAWWLIPRRISRERP